MRRATGKCVGPLPLILQASELFEQQNILYAYEDGATLLAVVRKPADRPAIATSFNRYLGLEFRIGAIAVA